MRLCGKEKAKDWVIVYMNYCYGKFTF